MDVGSVGMDDRSAEQEIEEASELAEEIATLTSEVEEDFQRIEAASTSEEMAHIYQCIDNFLDKVLPSMQKDVAALEKVVGSLQIHHESKNKPVNSFLKGVMGGHDEIPKLQAGAHDGPINGETLIKYCSAITIKNADELHAMIHARSVSEKSDAEKEIADQEDYDIL